MRIAYNDPTVRHCVEVLEANYASIKEEYMNGVLGSSAQSSSLAEKVAKPLESDYVTNLYNDHDKLHTGTWDWHSAILQGVKQKRFPQHFPSTSQILEKELGKYLFTGPFAYSFFSTLHPGAKIQPHSSPMNMRLRIHFPLIVPKDSDKCTINVGGVERMWEEGKAMVLDDSYVHSVKNESDEVRVLLLVDIW
jgi:hypothetical protein